MRQYAAAAFLILCFLACEDTDTPQPTPATDCDQFAVVDKDIYQTPSDDPYSILSANITEDCLELELTASGCDSENWNVRLIDSEAVAESFPVQRSIRIAFENPEACVAVFTRKYSFDLTPVRVVGDDTVILNLQQWRDEIRYEY